MGAPAGPNRPDPAQDRPDRAADPPPGFAVTVAFELASGARDAFLALVRGNARQSVASEPDCRRFDVLVPLADGPDVLLYEIYRDRAAFDAHLASEHFRRFDESTRDLVRRKTVSVFAVEEASKSDAPVPAPVPARTVAAGR